MNYQEVLAQARKTLGPLCKACPECNGRACRNTMPGPGAKGIGDVAIRNYDQWKAIRVNMDTLVEGGTCRSFRRTVWTSLCLSVFCRASWRCQFALWGSV